MRYEMGLIAALLAFVPGCTHRPPPAAPPPLPSYQVQDLGTLGGENSYVSSINNHGQLVGLCGPRPVAGQYKSRPEESQPFLWSGGKVTQLAPMAGRMACAAQINDSGQIVGTLDPHILLHPYNISEGVAKTSAFLWQKGHFTKLDTSVFKPTAATAINIHGDIIGQAEFGPDRSSGFLWHQGKVTEVLPSSGGASHVFGLNNAGQIAGSCGTDAVAWLNGSRNPTVIGVGGARAINNQGQVIGSGSSHAFVWQNGHLTVLETLSKESYSSPLGINDAGQIVGLSSPAKTTPPQKYNHAVLWQNGHLYDLNSVLPPRSSLLLAVATAINNRGQIVCQAMKDGKTHIVVLTPMH